MKQLLKRAINFLGFDLRKQAYNPEFTMAGLRRLSIQTVIDIGANQGQFSAKMMTVFPNARFYCFEPLPGPFSDLTLWARQHVGRVQTFNVALDENPGSAKMNCHVTHQTSSSLLNTTATNESLFPNTTRQELVDVEVSTLDDLLASSVPHMAREILIKLDVQGVEDRVIRGGATVFGSADACIVEVSIEDLYQGQARFRELLSLLEGLGFNYRGNMTQVLSPGGDIVYIDAVFRK